MLDSGAYRHIWGTDLVRAGLVFDIEDLERPSEVDTASGTVTLRQEGSIKLRGMVFRGAINPHMKISLISEGVLYTDDGWEVLGKDGKKVCKPPTEMQQEPLVADTIGKLAFWPHKDVVQALADQMTDSCMLFTQAEIENECYLEYGSAEDEEDAELEYSGTVPAGSGSCDEYPVTAPGVGLCLASPDSANPKDTVTTDMTEKTLITPVFTRSRTSSRSAAKQPATPYTVHSSDKNLEWKPQRIHYPEPIKPSSARGLAKWKAPSAVEQELAEMEATALAEAAEDPDGLLPSDKRSAWQKKHDDAGHPYHPRCKTCIMGGTRAKRALNKPTENEKKVLHYHQHLETVTTDTLKYNDTDVDGNKGASGLFVTKTSFGAVAQLKNFSSVANDKAFRKMQQYVQSNTDPGGKNKYALQRVKLDQGSEHKGAAADGRAESYIITTEGHVDRHTDQPHIENYFGRLQITAATIGVGAFDTNEDYYVDTMGTRIAHAADILRHRACSKMQKEMDSTPIQEQFHQQCFTEAPKHSYGELVFSHIEKKDRPNKTGPRAFEGIYAGQDSARGSRATSSYTQSQHSRTDQDTSSSSLSR